MTTFGDDQCEPPGGKSADSARSLCSRISESIDSSLLDGHVVGSLAENDALRMGVGGDRRDDRGRRPLRVAGFAAGLDTEACPIGAGGVGVVGDLIAGQRLIRRAAYPVGTERPRLDQQGAGPERRDFLTQRICESFHSGLGGRVIADGREGAQSTDRGG